MKTKASFSSTIRQKKYFSTQGKGVVNIAYLYQTFSKYKKKGINNC
jgi:hypothetical protein